MQPTQDNVDKFLNSDNDGYWFWDTRPSCEIEEVTDGSGKTPVTEYVELRELNADGKVMCKLRMDEFSFVQHVLRGYSTFIKFPMLFTLSRDEYLIPLSKYVLQCETGKILSYNPYMTDEKGFFIEQISHVEYGYQISTRFDALKAYHLDFNKAGTTCFKVEGNDTEFQMMENLVMDDKTVCHHIFIGFKESVKTQNMAKLCDTLADYAQLAETKTLVTKDELKNHILGQFMSDPVAPSRIRGATLTHPNGEAFTYVIRDEEKDKFSCQVFFEGSTEPLIVKLVKRTKANS